MRTLSSPAPRAGWGGSVGIHLNLTLFRLPCDHPGLRPLLNRSGEFAGDGCAMPLGPALLRGVAAEWSAQVDALRAKGVPLSHLDSHHHAHTVPALFPVVTWPQWRTGFRRVRATQTVYPKGAAPSARLMRKKRLWNMARRHLPPTRTASHFGALAAVTDALAVLPEGGIVEAMAHPGHPAMTAEAALAATPWWERAGRPVRLASYHCR